jgi:GT2 family glycosyltransferase
MISVIIINYNGKRFLPDCLSSLRSQVFKDFEVVLVDNNSSDGSVEFVERNFQEVRLVKLTHNHGFCGGNNQGIGYVRGELVAFLNNDTIVDPFWLAEICKAFDKYPQAGLCASKMLCLSDKSRIDNSGIYFSTFLMGHQRGRMKDENEFSQFEEIFGASGGAFAIRKSVLQDIGWFDEDFFAFTEDTDLSFRAQLRGYKCIFAPRARVFHFGGGTANASSDLSVYLIHRNMEWVTVKNVPTRLLLKYGWFHILYSLSWMLFWIFNGKGKVVLKAKLDALKNLRLMLSKRKQIQRNKLVSVDYINRLMKKRALPKIKPFLQILRDSRKLVTNKRLF